MNAGTLWRLSLACALVMGISFRLATAPARPSEAPVEPVVETIGIPVADLDRAVTFYSQVLLFEKVSEDRWPAVRMRLGDDVIELTESAARGRPREPLTVVVNDIEQAHLWLHRHHVEHRSALPLVGEAPAAGGIQAVYLEDPDGHSLQIVQFPPDQGAARWLRPSERVFLGIDDTTSSRREADGSFAPRDVSEQHGRNTLTQ